MKRDEKTKYYKRGTVRFRDKAFYDKRGRHRGFLYVTTVAKDRSHLNFYFKYFGRVPTRAKIFIDEYDNEYILVRLHDGHRNGMDAVSEGDYTKMCEHNCFDRLDYYERYYPDNYCLLACGINKEVIS